MLNSLQSLRGIFAIIIFFHHFSMTNEGGMFAAGGDAGVAFFFVLSGFVLSYGYASKIDSICESRENYGNFIWKRLSKLFPLHLLCLIWAIALMRFDVSLKDLINLLLLQAWIPMSDWYFSGNAVGWCLSDFVFFYLLFPFILPLTAKRKSGLLFCCVFLAYLFLFIPFVPEDMETALIYINPLSRLSDFILGILLYKLFAYNGKYKKAIVGNLKVVRFISVISFLFTIYLWYVLPERFCLNVLWWPSLCLIILSFALDNEEKSVLNNRYLVAFGDMSFSFYLIHVLYIRSVDIFLNKIEVTLSPFLRLGIILITLIVFSYLVKKLYEAPAERLLRHFLFRKRSSSELGVVKT